MARKPSPTILQDELYPPYAGNSMSAREELDDARLVDLDVAEESPFLRGQKRVSARRSSLPKKTVNRVMWACFALGILGVGAVVAIALYNYGERSWRFRIESSDNIEVTGIENVTKAQIMEVMGADIGRNIFFIPLSQQKAQLEQIPWVESASVMRFVPNRLQVEIHERRPIAFARLGSRIWLIDAGGTLMELPGAGKQKYSFPVIVGMNPGEPLSTRAARMRIYNQLLRELDSDGAHYSQDLSEVDISDQDDVKVLTNDSAGAVLVHLGSSDFLSRYKIYVTHVRGWRQQFEKLKSVDLRYEHQIILNPDMQGTAKAPQITPAAARAAIAAGVKPAALIHVVTPAKLPTPSHASAALPPNAGAQKPVAKPVSKKTAHKKTRWKPKARRTAAPKPAPSPGAKAIGPQPTGNVVANSTAKPAGKVTIVPHAPARNKPSAAIAKIQDQQDHP